MLAQKATSKQIPEETLPDSMRRHARYSLGREWHELANGDRFKAVALTLRDRLVDAMMATEERYQKANAKRLYYLSMEFLMGRLLSNNLHNSGVFEEFQAALVDMGVDLEEVQEAEPDPALGNGGLGRLAACFLDSLASLSMPGFGYGINYEYGLFKQEFRNGNQIEKPDNWLAAGSPWLVDRNDEAIFVPLYGRIEHGQDRHGFYNPMWLDWKLVVGVPRDMPVVGHGGRTVNFLRLFSARSSSDFDMEIFNSGDYFRAVEQKLRSETISKVLYPSDSIPEGQELRLVQEYFLVACAIKDIVRRFRLTQNSIEHFAAHVAVQLNDTHPALAVVELMRYLLDEADLPWEQAWDTTRKTFGYTNHTLLAEALEKWPVSLLEKVLPRHLQLIYEINRRFLDDVARVWPGDAERLRRMSLVEEGERKKIRMAHLAMVGSHSVNGVAALHSQLLQDNLFPDFRDFWPGKFNNKTNGVTPRRWIQQANPDLTSLLNQAVGTGWVTDLDSLVRLEPLAETEAFREQFAQVKRGNKQRLADYIKSQLGTLVDPTSLFDVQVKRIHEYKRQLLNALHIIHQYLQITEDKQDLPCPKTYLFAGKSAPGYWVAKQIIKLINNVADVVNTDKRSRNQLRVVFLPDYRVSLAELIIPAADLSEQISTAGKEASGTGNMKFAMNGALTIGTLDGANIEIREAVGADNIFIFGLKAEEIFEWRRLGKYRPREYYQSDPLIRRVIDSLRGGLFSADDKNLFDWVYHNLVDSGDEYFHLADFDSYRQAHQTAATSHARPRDWNRMAILNVARMGRFSSDRTIREYAADIWDITAV